MSAGLCSEFYRALRQQISWDRLEEEEKEREREAKEQPKEDKGNEV